MQEKQFNEITRAQHYNSHASGVECYDVIKHFNWALSSAIKYVWRAGMKDDSTKDLKKAVECLKREVKDCTELGKTIPEDVIEDLGKVYESEEHYHRKTFFNHLETLVFNEMNDRLLYVIRLNILIRVIEGWIRGEERFKEFGW